MPAIDGWADLYGGPFIMRFVRAIPSWRCRGITLVA